MEQKICKCGHEMKDIATTDWGDVWWCKKCGSVFCDFYNNIYDDENGRWYITEDRTHGGN